MTPVSNSPSHLLLQRRDESDPHSTRKSQHATASAFSSYSFGPLDDGNASQDKKQQTQAQGVAAQHNPLQSHVLPHAASMMAVLQGV